MANVDPQLLKPVDTREQLVWRYRQLAGNIFSQEEYRYLQAVFQKFSSGENYWTQRDFGDFILASLTDEVAERTKAAVPILYRWFLRSGCYPYHQDPEVHLTLDVLQVAISIILGRDSYKYRRNRTDESDDLYDQRMRQRSRRLLFQCLAHNTYQEYFDRISADDADLADAITLINRESSVAISKLHPAASMLLPKPLPVDCYPSSWSTRLEGAIPVKEFLPLLQLLLSCQFYLAGVGPEVVMNNETTFSETIEILLTVFKNNDNEQPQNTILWNQFESAIDVFMPQLFGTMSRLVSPFIRPVEITLEDVRALSRVELVQRLRSGISITTQPLTLANSAAANLYTAPLYAQLSTVLPQEMPYWNRPLLQIERPGFTSAGSLQHALDARTQERILLICGSPSGTTASVLSQKHSYLIYGLYLPANEAPPGLPNIAGPPLMFQLVPRHHVIRGTKGISAQSQQTVTNDPSSLEFEVQGTKLILKMSLHAESTGRWYDGQTGKDVSFKVQDVSLFKFDNNGFVDRRFFAPPKPPSD